MRHKPRRGPQRDAQLERGINGNSHSNNSTAKLARTNDTRFKLDFVTLLGSFLLLNLIVPQTIGKYVARLAELAKSRAKFPLSETSIQESDSALIKVTRFQVPTTARVGESRRLSCLYDLNGETLHAMKWFKDEQEFYRYSPGGRREENKMVFPLADVLVDLARSNDREVVLRSIQKRTAGVYKCQVSIEGTFKSVSAEKRMEVSDSIPWNQLAQEQQHRAGLAAGAPANNRQQQQRHATVHHNQQQQYYGATNGNNIASTSSQHQRQLRQPQASSSATSSANPVGPSWPVPLGVALSILVTLMLV